MCMEAFTEGSQPKSLSWFPAALPTGGWEGYGGEDLAPESTLSAQLAPSSQLRSTIGWLGGQASN